MVDHKNIFFVSIVILFFLFLFLYNIKSFYEGFGAYDTDPMNLSLVSPMDLAHTNLIHYDGRWNNSQTVPSDFPRSAGANIVPTLANCDWLIYAERYLIDLKPNTKEKVWEEWVSSGRQKGRGMDVKFAYYLINTTTNDPVRWNDLPFETTTINTKMNDFSISFWLYLNEVSDTWQPIFSITDRSLGVWLWPGNSSLFIQHASSPLPGTTNGLEDQFKNFSVPIKRAVFCTIVFSGKVVNMFINGMKTGSVPLASMVSVTGNSLEIGRAISRNNYAIKDFSIYNRSFGDDLAVALYKNQKQMMGGSVRFVRIQQQNQCLHVQEIEVYNETGNNVARTSKASQSSIGWNGTPDIAIDGNKAKTQGWPNSNHTDCGGIQWIELDLNKDVNVKKIVVYNRPDCCQARLIGAQLILLDKNRKQVGESFTLDQTLVQTHYIGSLSASSDDAYNFFNGNNREYFTTSRETLSSSSIFKDGSDLLKSWMNFGRIEPFTQIELPSEIKLQSGKTFNFYDFKPIAAGSNSSYTKKMENFTLKRDIYSIPEDKKMYYYSFDKNNQEYMNISDNILFKEKGCTFSMWFIYDPFKNAVWARIFDFGNGPAIHNILLGITDQMLRFFVFDGKSANSRDQKLSGSGYDWYHIAWTMNPVGNVWKIYLGGKLLVTENNRLVPISYEEVREAGTVTLTGSVEKIEYVKDTTESFKTFFSKEQKDQRNRQREQERQQRHNRASQQQAEQRRQQAEQRRQRNLASRQQADQRRQQRQTQPVQTTQQNNVIPNRGVNLQEVVEKPLKKQITYSSKTDIFKVPQNENQLIINDMMNTSMKNYTTNVTPAKNTIITLYSDINLTGASKTVQVPNEIASVHEFGAKSMKIEKIKSIEPVMRKNQYIGRSNWSNDPFFTGSIGDFRIFDTVLTDDQIKYIYENPKIPSNAS
jgi:hypothetical protein